MPKFIFDRIVEAHVAVMHPTKIDLTHCINVAICVAVTALIIGLFHAAVARRFKRVYFALHVFASVVIVALTAESGIRAFLNPGSSTLPPPGESPRSHYFMVWIFALHAYHPLFFRTNTMDWIHHIPVYVCTFLMFGCLSGDNFYAQALVLTGIPGGLDCLLLVIEGEGKLSRTRNKHLSALINNWLRAPLGFITGYRVGAPVAPNGAP